MQFKSEGIAAAGGFLFTSFWLWSAISMRSDTASNFYDKPVDNGASLVTYIWAVLSILIALAIYNYDVFLAVWQKYKQARFDAYDPNEKERRFDIAALIPNEQRRAIEQFFESVEQGIQAVHDVVSGDEWHDLEDAQLSRLGIFASQSMLLRAQQWHVKYTMLNEATLSVAVLADESIINTMAVYHYKGGASLLDVVDNTLDDNHRRRWWLRPSDLLACFRVVDTHQLFYDAQLEVLEPGGVRIAWTRTGAMAPEQLKSLWEVCQRFIEALVEYNRTQPDIEAAIEMLTDRLSLTHCMLWSAQSERYEAKSDADQQTMQRTLFEAISHTRDIRLLCAFEHQLQSPFWDALSVEAQRAVVGESEDADGLHRACVLQLWQWLCEDLNRDLYGWLSQAPLKTWFPKMLSRVTPYLPVEQMTPNAQVMAYCIGQLSDVSQVVEALGQVSVGHRCLWLDVLWRDAEMPERALLAQAFASIWTDDLYNAVSIALWGPTWSGDADLTDRLLGQMLLHRVDDTQRSDTLELMQRHGAVYSLMALRYVLGQDLLGGAVEDYAENLLERLESQYGEQANAMGQLSLSTQKAQGQLSVASGEQGGLSEV